MHYYMKAVENIIAWGHESILAENTKTFEITKEWNLTKRGDCVIAVAADKGIVDLSGEFKGMLRKEDTKLTIVVRVGGEEECVEAWGSPKLTFRHLADIVVRRSDYICDRTLAIKANKVAKDFSRSLVAKLKNPQQRIDITLIAGTVP